MDENTNTDEGQEKVVEKTQEQPEQKRQDSEVSDTVIQEAVQRALGDPKIKQELMNNQGFSEKDVKKLLEEDRRKVADAILGTKPESKPDPILESLVRDPAHFVQTVKELTLNEYRQEAETSRRQQEELTSAFNETLQDRPDIYGKKSSQKVFASLYEKTDASKTPKERFKQALADFDATMEELGVVKQDPEELQGLDSASGGVASIIKTTKDTKTEWVDSQKEKHAAWEKAMNV
jgi:hypothetical protein